MNWITLGLSAVIIVLVLIIVPLWNDRANLKQRVTRLEVGEENDRARHRELKEQLNFLLDLVKQKL